jgi:transposase
MADGLTLLPERIESLGEGMKLPDEVAAMLRLRELGWGSRRIARELGCSRETVRRWLEKGIWRGYRRGRGRPKKLDGLDSWLAEKFRQHRGNADVVRQDLEREKDIRISLRTLERSVAHLRQELLAEARATVRFETAPGRQLQVDFGELRLAIGDEPSRLFLFVATLGYSRRIYVQAFRHERQWAWFAGMEGAFRHFAGLPEEVLFDNAKALVDRHDRATREVIFNQRLHAFARYWGFRPHACAPYRARTKGKDERGVGYVKRNAIAGHVFGSWAELEAHLAWWMREVADARIHGTTGEVPAERFTREEMAKLKPLNGRPSFLQIRELLRRVSTEGCIEVDTNHYSVPWRLIGCQVSVLVSDGQLRVLHAGTEVALHGERRGRRERSITAGHLAGIATNRTERPITAPVPASSAELLRPLSEYERVIGGGW